jgi:hypothetical protein
MKTIFKLSSLLLLVLLYACGQKSHEHGHEHEHAHDAADTSANAKLYSDVMAIHDEVMPKMGDIYTLKEGLKKKLEDNTEGDKKSEIESTITKLDEADKAMRVWMREFKPEDITDEAKKREYLDNEMEKVKKVREDMLAAIEQAKAL